MVCVTITARFIRLTPQEQIRIYPSRPQGSHRKYTVPFPLKPPIQVKRKASPGKIHHVA